MADVTVEFGAQDVGLEKTLKAVQAEMAGLKSNITETGVVGEELQTTMRKMAQLDSFEKRLRAMADETGGLTGELAKATPKIEDIGGEIRKLEEKINGGNLSITEMKTAVADLSSLKRLEKQVLDVRSEFEKVDAPVKQFENVIKSAGDIAMTVDQRLASVSREITDLREHAKTASITVDQFENTMKKIAQLESTEKRLKSMGSEAADAAPKLDAMGRELQGVGEKANGIGGFFDSSFQKIAGAVSLGNIAAAGFNKAVDIAFTAAQSVVQGFGDALDLGGRLSELSARTGESAGKLLVLETAFKNSGLGAETVGTAINKLQNFMQDAANGGDKQVGAMKRLGISLAELQGKTPTEQMQIFADKIAAIDDPTQRAAASSDVFGDKLGGKLLPLLNDFSPALDDAREKVGSMEQVMDENAATFDAAGETIDAVKGKMAAFAAGVLSEVIPAVSGLGEEMAKVDFASFGELVGESLVETLEKFKDTTAGANEIVKVLNTALGNAVNAAIPVDNAFKKVGDSTVELYNGFEKARSYTSLFGAALDLLTTYGSKVRTSQDSAAEGIANAGDAAGDASGKIGEVGTASDAATGKVGALGTQASATGESIASSFSLNSDFVPQLDSVASAWGGINDQVTGNKELLTSNLTLGESLVGKTDEQKQSLGGINEQLDIQKQFAKTIEDTYGKHAEKATQIATKQDEINAKESARKELLQAGLDFDLQINQAKASGNTELAASLESQKEFNAELKKAIDAGMGEPEAKAFAQAMLNAKAAADGIAGKVVNISVTTTVSDKPWRDLLASLDATPNEKTIAVSLEVTGTDNLVDARNVLDACESKNVTAAFGATGVSSLEELSNKINGIPNQKSVTAAMEITGEEDLDTALGNLQRFGGTRQTKLTLEKYGFENLTELSNQINGLPDTKTAKIAAEAFGLEDVSLLNNVLDTLMEKNGKSVSVTANVDSTAAMASISSLYDSANTTFATPLSLNLEGDQSIAAVRNSAEGNFAAPIAFNLDGNQTIADVRSAAEANFSNPITLSMSGSQAANDVYSTVNSAFATPVELGVNADTSTAQTEVAILGSAQTATISADTTDAQSQVAGLGSAQTATISADTTGAQSQVASLGGPQTFTLSADTTAAGAQVAGLGNAQTVSINADTTEAQTQVASLGASQTATISADSAEAQSQVASLGSAQTATINADTATAEQAVASLGGEITLPTSADTTGAQAAIAGIGTDLTLDLNADTSIAAIRQSLKEGIELDISAKSGTSSILETIKGFVESIKTAVEKIEPKLPQRALA
jgi:cell division protein FtsL